MLDHVFCPSYTKRLCLWGSYKRCQLATWPPTTDITCALYVAIRRSVILYRYVQFHIVSLNGRQYACRSIRIDFWGPNKGPGPRPPNCGAIAPSKCRLMCIALIYNGSVKELALWLFRDRCATKKKIISWFGLVDRTHSRTPRAPVSIERQP
jgi:hypothetical protein